jgi:hypothetical protein
MDRHERKKEDAKYQLRTYLICSKRPVFGDKHQNKALEDALITRVLPGRRGPFKKDPHPRAAVH